MQRSSISIGLAVNNMLSSDKELGKMINKIFPVVTDVAELPYVAYRRTGTEQISVKGYNTGAEKVSVQVNCYSASYGESIDIAEKVRSILDGASCQQDDICVRSIVMQNAEETWESDAFVQKLFFEIKC